MLKPKFQLTDVYDELTSREPKFSYSRYRWNSLLDLESVSDDSGGRCRLSKEVRGFQGSYGPSQIFPSQRINGMEYRLCVWSSPLLKCKPSTPHSFKLLYARRV